MHFWRNKEGHEVDAVVECGGTLHGIEIKAGQTDRYQCFRVRGRDDDGVDLLRDHLFDEVGLVLDAVDDEIIFQWRGRLRSPDASERRAARRNG